MKTKMWYIEKDQDHVGNIFPAYYVENKELKNKFVIDVDIPLVIGMKNQVEIMTLDLDKMKTLNIQFPQSMFQPYIIFHEDCIHIWNENLPFLNNYDVPDHIFTYKELSKHKEIDL